MRFLLLYIEYLHKFLSTCRRKFTIERGKESKATNKAENMLQSSQTIVNPDPIELTSIISRPKLSIVPEQTLKPITVEWVRNFTKEHEISVEARDYQERIVVKAINMILFDNISSILVEAPTGAGKTVIALLITKILKEIKGLNTSWTTARRNLLVQTGKTDRNKNFGVKPTFISMFSKEAMPNDVLVVDEAHKDACSSCANIHSMVDPQIVILLSATPIRSDRATIFYQRLIRDAGIRALIRQGYLANFNHYAISKWTPSEVAKCYLREPDKWGKSVVFFHKMDECLEFQSLLAKAGVECELVTGQTDREAQIERLENGEVKILVNMMVLCEGFDMVSLESVFVRDSSKGPTLQMAGRVLRKFGNTVKNVIQSKQTKYPFTREASAKAKFLWTDDEGWKQLEINKMVDAIVADSLRQLAMVAMDENQRSSKLIDHLKKKRLTKPKRDPHNER